MIPVGYMAKRVYKRADWVNVGKKKIFLDAAPQVVDIYSVSGCLSENFAEYIPYWKHNGYWLFDSPDIIKNVASENSIHLQDTALFYYEAHEMEFDGECWSAWSPELSFPTNVILPLKKQLEGFDVVCFNVKTNPECSPLSCNSMAEKVHTNAHCLFESYDEAKKNIDDGVFKDAEPGPYRIFSVYSIDWS